MSPDTHLRQDVETLLAPLTAHATGPGRSAAPTGRLPVDLDSALARLEASVWPEVVGSWSRLTPSGFPLEVTVLPDGSWQWTAEVAGPELPEAARLPHALALLDGAGQPVDPVTGRALLTAQTGQDLSFGAWFGGRGRLLKLYAEVGADEPSSSLVGRLGALAPPDPVPAGLARLPYGTLPRMYGVTPGRGKTELYLRLPDIEAADLLPFLHTTGHAHFLDALRGGLPDGLRRLWGRRLGLSITWSTDGTTEPALFVSARTLFPAHPEGLLRLAPQLAAFGREFGGWRPCGVTLAPHPAHDGLLIAAGLCPPRPRTAAMPRASQRPGSSRLPLQSPTKTR